jgi:glycosyltransferase involved in cell wall biosynthesis
MKHVVVLVSNDVVFDQRIQKTASTLGQLGYRVSFVGRKHANSPPLPEGMVGRRYRLPFRTGPGFYGALQAAFVADVLTRRRFDVVWANDLDTLFPARIAGWLRRVPVVFDSHEFFTEHAGLAERPRIQGFWRWWERRLMPGLKAVITVNDAIADAFVDRFPGASFGRPLVVRNMPPLRAEMPRCDRSVFAPYGIPTDRPIALLQGAYLDRDRGVLDAVNLLEAMEDVRLVLVGAGEEWDAASALAARGVGGGRLHCLPRLPFAALCTLTAGADVGLSLDRDTSGNYRMSLPNKLFDYVHAGLPVVATALPEVRRVVEGHRLGEVVEKADPEALARAVRAVLEVDREVWRVRAADAALHLHWGVDAPRIAEALNAAGAA